MLSILIIIIIQIFTFYILPLMMPEPFSLIILILLLTFILSILIGTINNKLKYFYPPLVALVFLPSILIYYNSSALIHSIWYLMVSIIGLIIGLIISKLINKSLN